MHLVELGQGVFCLTSIDQGFGNTNVGLVIDADGLTVVDTGPCPAVGHTARRQILELTEQLELPIKRVVLTSSRVPFAGGSWALWSAAFFGTQETSDQLDAPVNHAALRALLPDFADHYHDEFETRPITHVVDEAAWLTPASRVAPLQGESPSNLVVQAPGTDVVFAGALASFGVTPLAFDGDPEAWIATLDEIIDLGATIVPGHGPVGGRADVADLRAYLEACIECDGDPTALPTGPWDSWTDRRFDAVNVERAARLRRGDSETPHAMFTLLGLDRPD